MAQAIPTASHPAGLPMSGIARCARRSETACFQPE